MEQAITGILTVMALVVLSRRADRRLAAHPRLPMQWGFDGAVTWTAPRRIALSFTPVLAAATFAFLGMIAQVSAPRPGQEGLVLPVTIGIGVGLVAIHRLHLWLIARTLARGRG